MANPNLKRAVRVALLAASAGSALYGTVSVAQDAELEQVIVTGSRIPQPNLEGTSPVSVVGAQEIKFQGVQQVEDLINNLPQVFAGQGGSCLERRLRHRDGQPARPRQRAHDGAGQRPPHGRRQPARSRSA